MGQMTGAGHRPKGAFAETLNPLSWRGSPDDVDVKNHALIFDFDHDSAHVITAVGADRM